ncbi:MAG: TonB-dependent receptor [Acidobacteriota bacterium]
MKIDRASWWGMTLWALVALPAGLLAEGTQTGVLTGRVVDPSEQPLPQVAVTLRGAQGERQVTTDDQGQFRFPALRAGVYEARAELLGLEARRSDLRIFIDRTTETTLHLGEQTEESTAQEPVETFQVVAFAPLIDRFDTRVGTSVSRAFLDRLPVERFYQSVALLLPGVAGGADGNPNVSGARRSNNLFLVDGVDTTDPTTGLFGLNLSFEAVNEVEVTQAALPVEWGRVSGAPINVVTRSGGRELQGGVRWLASGGRLRDDYSDPAPVLALDVAAANTSTSDLDQTVAATLSGPLKKDHLWFFAAVERAEGRLSRPTLEGSRWNDGTRLGTNDVKLSARPGQGHTLEGQLTTDDATFAGFSVFDRNPAENRVGAVPRQLSNSFLDRIPGDVFALQDNDQQGDFARLSWDWVATQNLAVSATAGTQDRRLERRPRGARGITGGAPHVGDNPLIDFNADPVPGEQLSAVFNGITDQGFETRDRDQAGINATAFLRSGAAEHEIRFGVDVQRTRSLSKLNASGPSGIDPATGMPTEGRLFLDLDLRDACFFDGQCLAFDPRTGEFQPDLVRNFWRRAPQSSESETLALFASESLSIGRLLLSLGVRYETVRGTGGGQRLVDDDAFAPRLGLKLDPKNTGRTLLSATYGRFFETFPQAFLDAFVSPPDLSGFSEYQWAGALEEDPADCSGQDPADLTSPCWLFQDAVPLDPLQLADPNLALRRSSVDELTLGVEQQLTPHIDLRVTYVDREWRDLWDDLIELGEDELGEFVTLELANLPQARRTYEALMVLLKKRFADRWQLLASYTWSRAEGNLFSTSGRATFADYQGSTDVNLANRFGPAPYDRPQQLKLFANYRLPLGRFDLTLGTAVRLDDGTPFQQESDEDLGTRFLTRRGSERLDELFQVDLSANLEITTAKGIDLLSKLEIFNLTNESTRLGAETDVDSGVFGLPRSLADLQRPRSIRWTLGVRF